MPTLSNFNHPTDSVELTKRHYTRLRHYWSGRASGAASMTDAIDMDLVKLKYIKRLEKSGTPYFIITPLGEDELIKERTREIARRAPHHDLGSRLSTYLRTEGRVTWENIEFIVRYTDTNNQSQVYAARPDVFAMMPTYNEDKMNPCVYEVKVSRSDFLTDIAKPEKRQAYQQLCNAMYYVCVEGLIKPEEVPAECGLMVELPNHTFKILKKAKKRKVVLSPRHFMNLILKKPQYNSLY